MQKTENKQYQSLAYDNPPCPHFFRLYKGFYTIDRRFY